MVLNNYMCVKSNANAFLLIIFNCIMRFKPYFPYKFCMFIDSVPVSTQVTLLMTSSPSFPISGIKCKDPRFKPQACPHSPTLALNFNV